MYDLKKGLGVSLTHTVSLQHYVSPAVIHMAIQYAVAFVNNAVAIKSFAMFNYTSFGCVLFYCCPPSVCVSTLVCVCVCADYSRARL